MLATVLTCAPAATEPRSTVQLERTGSLSAMTLDDALRTRRSVREFTSDPVVPGMVGRLLWAGQGVTSPDGKRTAPSAGALYPLDLYAVAADGATRYRPAEHDLVSVTARDLRDELATAALGDRTIADAALVIVIAGDVSRTATRYGLERGERYVLLEAGHVAQNILLEAVALGLGGVPIGAFDDDAVSRALGLRTSQAPFYLIALGHPRSSSSREE